MSAPNKLEMLRRELGKINARLPSNAYIPLTSRQVCNSVILHIPPQEAQVFVTNKRAPYLIALEVFDPLEVAYEPETTNVAPEVSAKSEVLPAPPLIARQSYKHKQPHSFKVNIREVIEKELAFHNADKKNKVYSTPPITLKDQEIEDTSIVGHNRRFF